MEHMPIFSIDPVLAQYPEPEDLPAGDRRWILTRGAEVLYTPAPPAATVVIPIPLPAGIVPERVQYLGRLGALAYYAGKIPPGTPLPESMDTSPVRPLHGIVPDHDLALAAYALRILDFDEKNTFCGRCGARTRSLRTERARLCTDCNLIVYPRISPAIIVLIKKGDSVLLARSPRFPAGVLSVIAGFVEPGENLERAVHREVFEEVGIRVTNIHYFGSEPWPFPDSLMLGFVADHAGGDIAIDRNEIESAGWFTRDNLPPLPSQLSISRALIDAWAQNKI